MSGFLELCKKLGIKGSSKNNKKLLEKSIIKHQENTMLFLICGYNYIEKIDATKWDGIKKLFIIPGKQSSPFSLNDDGLLTINIDKETIDSLSIEPFSHNPKLILDVLAGDKGLNSENAIQSLISDLGSASVTRDNKNRVERRLNELSILLHPYWKNNTKELGLPKTHLVTFFTRSS